MQSLTELKSRSESLLKVFYFWIQHITRMYRNHVLYGNFLNYESRLILKSGCPHWTRDCVKFFIRHWCEQFRINGSHRFSYKLSNSQYTLNIIPIDTISTKYYTKSHNQTNVFINEKHKLNKLEFRITIKQGHTMIM